MKIPGKVFGWQTGLAFGSAPTVQYRTTAAAMTARSSICSHRLTPDPEVQHLNAGLILYSRLYPANSGMGGQEGL
jgi:hypothetical protein